MASGPRRAQDVFTATLELLAARGFDGLTIEGVAERCGVNKTTIYRWWPSKAALVAAALAEGAELDLDVPDTGTLRGDLAALVGAVVALLTEPPAAGIALAALGAAARNPELAAHARAFFADRLARERPVSTVPPRAANWHRAPTRCCSWTCSPAPSGSGRPSAASRSRTASRARSRSSSTARPPAPDRPP
ncbi:TetR/AcrR family transcriptional regulator [Actinomadura sp. CNU-125]|uniref:TetR/AcrR family transcriptional regulator n=1 Tax=Actinomadura sp. CNU-125 TaxID=1904961 RepID=UPI000A56314D|nr:TetR/AcrR family transcriptional regulator [Actinomadura sp. CNU-125]